MLTFLKSLKILRNFVKYFTIVNGFIVIFFTKSQLWKISQVKTLTYRWKRFQCEKIHKWKKNVNPWATGSGIWDENFSFENNKNINYIYEKIHYESAFNVKKFTKNENAFLSSFLTGRIKYNKEAVANEKIFIR